MTSEIDFDAARIYAIPLVTRFRDITVRERMLIEGSAGRGGFCVFASYDRRSRVRLVARDHL